MWSLAKQIQNCRKVEVSQPIGLGIGCAWPLGPKAPQPLLEEPMITYEAHGWSKKYYHVRCDAGTHMDSPAHRAQGGRDIGDMEAQEQIAPLVVLHVERKVEKDQSYAVSLEDLEEYERKWGEIPPRAIVAAATGWASDRWSKGVDTYYNGGVFPGFSFALAEFLVNERNICGIAIDTLSGDVGCPKGGFPVHDFLLVKHSKFIIENCLFDANLPPAGGTIIALPPKVKNAPEMIVRCVVLIQQDEAAHL